MNITSPAFENSAPVPSTYTCDAENINPPLHISGIHSDAKSLILIADDPDAPGGTWVHWVVWNIHPSVSEISQGSVPEGGIEGRTSFGRKGYGGPCPSNGMHRYLFKLYALDITLNIPLTSEISDVLEAMKGHVLGDAKLMGTYERK